MAASEVCAATANMPDLHHVPHTHIHVNSASEASEYVIHVDHAEELLAADLINHYVRRALAKQPLMATDLIKMTQLASRRIL